MNSLIKGSKLVMIERCGHVPQEELPERVFGEIAKFIELHLKLTMISNEFVEKGAAAHSADIQSK